MDNQHYCSIKQVKYFLLYFVFFCIGKTYSQTEIEYDTNYIQTYTEDFYPYLFLNERKYTLSMYHLQDSVAYNYIPNSSSTLGIGLNYKIISFSIGATTVKRAGENSSSFTFGTGMNKRKFRLAFSYQYYKGFSYSKRDSVAGMDSTYIFNDVRPDLTNQNITVSFFKIFNHTKASYRGAFSYFEKQKKSAASWTLGSNLTYRNIQDQELLFGYDSLLSPSNQLKKASTLGLSINGGGFFTLLLSKNWHFSFYAALNIYYSVNLSKNKGAEYNPWGSGTDSRALLGYDNTKYFFGLTGYTDLFTKDGDKYSFETKLSYVEFYFGRRFSLNLPEKYRFL